MTLIMAVFSYFLVGVPMLVTLVIHYFHTSKKDSFYNLMTLAVAINANVVSKVLVKEYRPFLQFAEIKALNCECSFGMPSGHSATVTIGVLVMLEAILQIRKLKLPLRDAELSSSISTGEYRN